MANSRNNQTLIRGLSDQEIEYLKAQAKRQNFPSFNAFLVAMCREKIEQGQFNHAQYLYAEALENMKEASKHTLAMVKKQGQQLDEFEKKMAEYSGHISRWLEYEGMVEDDDEDEGI
ncbi:TPA: hypothetical protein ACIN9P_001949 [Streptococcus agalactiae]